VSPRSTSLGLNIPYVEHAMDGATPRWADILAMARAAESVGFDAVWVSDHVGFGDPEGEWSGGWESWTLLSALAAAVPGVRLGTYVLAMPYRNPALLAKMAETLDEVSGGRVILGVGAGWNEPEFASYSFPWERRFDRFEEGLRILTAMLRHGRATVDGRLEHAASARLAPRGPRPAGLPPLDSDSVTIYRYVSS
jgi:alkanesulfonate monooxygenase SsuD/methylene tetrahydromethanopterin reductase-like flavin-dependent oxidoreductase (luciferase family)